MIFLYFILHYCETLYINILYEKLVEPDLEPLYKDIITSILDKYNVYLRQADVEIKIQDVLSYNVYSQDPEYKYLQKSSGTDDLSERMRVILNMNKAILLIASSQGIQSDIYYNLSVPCLSKYVTTFSNNSNLDIDTVSAISGSIERWLSEILQVDIPKPFGTINLGRIRKFIDDVSKSKFKKRVEKCISKNNILENKSDFNDQLKSMAETIPDVNIIPEANTNLNPLPAINIADKIIDKNQTVVKDNFRTEKEKEVNKDELIQEVLKQIENKMNVKIAKRPKNRRQGFLTRPHEHVGIKQRNT